MKALITRFIRWFLRELPLQEHPQSFAWTVPVYDFTRRGWQSHTFIVRYDRQSAGRAADVIREKRGDEAVMKFFAEVNDE